MAAVGKEQFSCSISGKIKKVICLKKLVFILIEYFLVKLDRLKKSFTAKMV